MRFSLYAAGVLFTLCTVSGAEPFQPDRCEIVPLADHQVSFRIDGAEKLRWHYGPQYPRPFFFPFISPSGGVLTRMGHPGAQDHDHHRSIWFAHNDVNGANFWADTSDARIRQVHWYAYHDGNDEAVMATLTRWQDGQGNAMMDQEIVAALIPMENGEHALEVQLRMVPSPGQETVQLGKTNFGFLAVRVAKSLSEHFGAGKLTSSEGQTGEPDIFGKQARWMDYSGPVVIGENQARQVVTEGITYFDHPSNPRYPTRWHVRQDGWMGASFCMDEGLAITADKPLTLRYLLHAHTGAYDHAKATAVLEGFAQRPGFRVAKSKRSHHLFEVTRLAP